MKDIKKKFLEKLQNYNEKAEAWDYEKLTFDADNKVIVGAFEPKFDKTSGFFNKIKIAYTDGYMEEEYFKLLQMLENYDR